MSLSELKLKDVVNVDTGKKLGRVMDIEFSVCDGCVQAIVVPGDFKLGSVLKGEKTGVVIPSGAAAARGRGGGVKTPKKMKNHFLRDANFLARQRLADRKFERNENLLHGASSAPQIFSSATYTPSPAD